MDTIADTTIAIFGAGGNMGGRITNALKDDTTYRMLYVETSPAGQAKLADFSAGCKQAIANAKSKIFKDDWKQVFEPANLMVSVNSITAE